MSKRVRQPAWSGEEDLILKQIHFEGISLANMPEYFNNRTLLAIKSRIHFLELPNRSRRLSKEEFKTLVELRDQNKSLQEISEKLNICKGTISRYVTSGKIKYSEKQKSWTKEEETLLSELVKDGLSIDEISSVMHRSWISVSRKADKLKLSSNLKPNGIDICDGEIEIPFETLIKQKLSNAKSAAKENGLGFEIDSDFVRSLWNKQGGKCFYSGKEMLRRRSKWVFSIDRLNSSIGYIPTNCVLCCLVFNKMKLHHLPDDFILLCKMVAEYNQLK